jgi:hypothetical protein
MHMVLAHYVFYRFVRVDQSNAVFYEHPIFVCMVMFRITYA